MYISSLEEKEEPQAAEEPIEPAEVEENARMFVEIALNQASQPPVL